MMGGVLNGYRSDNSLKVVLHFVPYSLHDLNMYTSK